MIPDDLYHHLVDKLMALRRRMLRDLWLERLMMTAGLMLMALAAVVVLEMLFHLPTIGRWILVLLLTGAVMVLCVRYLSKPVACILGWDDSLTLEQLSMRLGLVFEDIRDRLRNALQLYRNRSGDKALYSSELVTSALEQTGAAAMDRDFEAIVDRAPLYHAFRYLLVGAGCWALGLMIWFAPVAGGLHRLTLPSVEFPLLPDFTVMVDPGDADIVRGDPFTVTARAMDGQPDVMVVAWEDTLTGERGENDMTQDDAHVYRYDFTVTERPFRYHVRGIDRSLLMRDREYQTPEYAVHVRYRPEVRRLKVRLEPPGYSGLPASYLEDNIGDVAALKGTRVLLDVAVNKPVTDAALVFENGRRSPLQQDGATLAGSFQLEQSERYAIFLRDVDGLENAAPIEHWISVIEDEFPLVQIVEPGQDVDLDDRMQVDLAIRMLDDYGFSRARLGYVIVRTDENGGEQPVQFLPLRIPDLHSVSQEIQFQWQLGDLPLVPEDIIRYFVEVYDNDLISGPKRSVSEQYYARFPSMEEIFAEVEATQNEGISDLEDVVEEQREFQEALKDLAEELRRDPETSWEERREVEQAMQRQDELQQQVDDVQKKYEELLEKMDSQDMVSVETMKKYMEMQDLFEEILSSDLKDKIRELQQKMFEEVKPEDLQQALQEVQMSQEDYLKRLERTVDILKQVQMEQRMDQAVKMAENLLERQQEVLEQIPQQDSTGADASTGEQPQETPERPMEQLARDEQKLQQDAGALDEHVARLMEEGADMPQMPQDQLDAARRMMDDPSLMQPMEQTRQALQNGEPQQAMEQGRQARRQMQDIRDQLQSARESMIAQQKQQLTADMIRTARDLVELSRRQEVLKNDIGQIDRASPRYREKAQAQADVMAGLNRVAQRLMELSRQTFYITPQMGKSVGQAFSEMQQALSQMEERNSSAAQQSAGKAMSSLNTTALQLGQAMQRVNQGDSPSGLQDLLKQLSQMAGAQQGINDQTMDLPFGNRPGGRSPAAQQALMQRLAQQQRMLQQSLQSMAEDMRSREEMLGDMGNVAGEMEDVIKDLEQRSVNDRTLQRQRRILSRLLDAQRSLQRRDYSRKRQSETGAETPVVSPGALPADLGESLKLLQQELLQALKEGYSRDYEQLIRKYFEALSRWEDAAATVP